MFAIDIHKLTVPVVWSAGIIVVIVSGSFAMDRQYVDNQEQQESEERLRQERTAALQPLKDGQLNLQQEVRALSRVVQRGFGEAQIAELEREQFMLRQVPDADLTPRDRERGQKIQWQLEQKRRELEQLGTY